jgi:hypothetical protein
MMINLQDIEGYSYVVDVSSREVLVEKLTYQATKVSLIGPHIGNFGHDWMFFQDWQKDIRNKWIEYCHLIAPMGNWGTSHTIDENEEHYILHYWFDNMSDAVIFKLSFCNYC